MSGSHRNDGAGHVLGGESAQTARPACRRTRRRACVRVACCDSGSPSRSIPMRALEISRRPGSMRTGKKNGAVWPPTGDPSQDGARGNLSSTSARHTSDDSRLIRPSSAETPNFSGQPSRYQLIGELARGGIGAIFQGRDLDLGRDLAVKVIREEHRDRPDGPPLRGGGPDRRPASAPRDHPRPRAGADSPMAVCLSR